MISLIIISLIVLLLTVQWLRSRQQYQAYPPGPWGLPIIGHIPFLGKDPSVKFEEYRKQYGDVFSIRLGSRDVVVLNGVNTIKDALTTHPDDFGGRPLLYSFQLISDRQHGNVGLSIPFGPKWKMLRKVTNNALRTFANFRTSPVEDIVLEEGNRLIDFFLAQKQTPIFPRRELFLSVGSVIYQILFGRNANIREDRNYCAMIEASNDFVEFASVGNPVDIAPWTRVFFRGRTEKFLKIIDIPYKVMSMQRTEHLETYDSDSLRDVMDSLLKSASELSREEREQCDLPKDLVMSTTVDLLGAGFDTVGSSLLWGILMMCLYPDIQTRVQKNIDETVGTSRRPSMVDKKDLTYVEATVLEIMRFACFVPLSVPRLTTTDVKLNGYLIPEGTFIIVNQFSTCRDSRVWGDPEAFRPDRFLKTSDTGGMEIDQTMADSFLQFGAGRRRCIGEFLAKVETFLFFTLLMQRCKFSLAEDENFKIERQSGLTTKPKPYRVIVTERMG